MALLDTDHSYTYDGAGEGDLYSEIKKVKTPDKETELTLSKTITKQQTVCVVQRGL